MICCRTLLEVCENQWWAVAEGFSDTPVPHRANSLLPTAAPPNHPLPAHTSLAVLNQHSSQTCPHRKCCSATQQEANCSYFWFLTPGVLHLHEEAESFFFTAL